jgi:hypothetical protein
VKARCQSLATHTPSPDTANNYYYSGNWYYSQQGPMPREGVEKHGEARKTGPNQPEPYPSPISAVNKQDKENGIATNDKNAIHLILDPVPTDWPIIVVNVLLVVLVGFQLRLLSRTFLAEHRPQLDIKHVILLNDPKADLIGVPINVRLFIVNRGSSKAKIIEGNTTLQFVQRGKFGELWEFYSPTGEKRRLAMPPRDPANGVPLYSEERNLLAGLTLKAGRTIQIEQSIQGKADDPLPYLAIADMKVDVFFYVFGYFTYGNRLRSYTTAFCRRYERRERRFAKTDDSDYEYSD